MSNLEQDFDKIAEQINAKIQEAADALKEVNRLASEANLKAVHFNPYVGFDDYAIKKEELHYHQEMIDRIDFSPLLAEMDRAGWVTSSFDC
jgi:hypothetical protein